MSPRRPETVESHADQAYKLIRTHIIFGQFEPGEVLSEEHLMTRFRLGRTPIREALVRLGHDGLLTAFPRRGTQVRTIDFTDLAAIYEVRAPLETQAGRLAATRVDDPIRATSRRLAAAIGKPRRSSRDGGQGLLKLDEEIHRFVYEASKSPLLQEALNHYLDLSLRILYVAMPTRPLIQDVLAESLVQQKGLLSAIEVGDAATAESAVASNLHDLQQALTGAISSFA